MRKSLLVLLLTVAVLLTSVLPCFAWSGEDWEYAYWTENAVWMEPDVGYGVQCNLSYSQYLNLGQPISVTIPGSGKPYPECANLSDIDLVARVIYAEICNVPPKDDNAVAEHRS